jgi:hypothetical protein
MAEAVDGSQVISFVGTLRAKLRLQSGDLGVALGERGSETAILHQSTSAD